jgi:hypothetical protein
MLKVNFISDLHVTLYRGMRHLCLVAKRDRLQEVLNLFIPRNESAFKPYSRSIDNQSAN